MSDVTTFLDDWTAAEQRGDVAALDEFLTDDFVGVGPLGFELPKAAWLARHSPGEMHYDTFAVDEVTVHSHGGAALVVARHTAKGDYHGNPIPEAARASLTLIDEDGSWHLAGIHLSFIAGTPGAPPIPGAPPAAAPGGEPR